METIDILPTIFDELGLRLPEKVDGKPASSPAVQARDTIRILERGTFKPIRIPAAEFEAEKAQVLASKLRLFGEGADGPGRIYRIGPNQELIGRPARGAGLRPLRVDLSYAREYGNVDLRSATVPVHVVGRVRGKPRGSRRDVAIAVNGRIAAVSRSFALANDPQELVAAVAPQSAWRQGRNQVEILEVE